jgi:hypothetical protein
VTGESSSPEAIRYSVPQAVVKASALNPWPGAGVTAPARPGRIAQDSVRSIVSRMLPEVRFSSNIRLATANICRVLPGCPARICRHVAWPCSCTHSYTSRMVRPVTAAAHSSAARATSPLASNHRMSPLMSGTLSHAAIRRAITRSLHGPRRSHFSVDGTPPTSCGLNAHTGPRSHRAPAVDSYRSARVDVASTGPG